MKIPKTIQAIFGILLFNVPMIIISTIDERFKEIYLAFLGLMIIGGFMLSGILILIKATK